MAVYTLEHNPFSIKGHDIVLHLKTSEAHLFWNHLLVHYEGVFWDRRYNDTSDMESQMYTPVEKIKEFLANEIIYRPYSSQSLYIKESSG